MIFAPRWVFPWLALTLASTAVPAQPAGDTMNKIRSSRTIVLGVREAARPFSFVNAQKQSVGYSVDLCLNAVDEIKRELKLPDLKVQYKLVSGPERIPKLLQKVQGFSAVLVSARGEYFERT